MIASTRLQRLVKTVYASGYELHLSPSGTVLARNPKGEVSFALTQQVSREQEALYRMMTDPDSEEAYEGRSALFHAAMGHLDSLLIGKHGERAVDRAVKAMCNRGVIEQLNRAWHDGDFEVFRDALREYVRLGLRAGRGEKIVQAMVMEAAG